MDDQDQLQRAVTLATTMHATPRGQEIYDTINGLVDRISRTESMRASRPLGGERDLSAGDIHARGKQAAAEAAYGTEYSIDPRSAPLWPGGHGRVPTWIAPISAEDCTFVDPTNAVTKPAAWMQALERNSFWLQQLNEHISRMERLLDPVLTEQLEVTDSNARPRMVTSLAETIANQVDSLEAMSERLGRLCGIIDL